MRIKVTPHRDPRKPCSHCDGLYHIETYKHDDEPTVTATATSAVSLAGPANVPSDSRCKNADIGCRYSDVQHTGLENGGPNLHVTHADGGCEPSQVAETAARRQPVVDPSVQPIIELVATVRVAAGHTAASTVQLAIAPVDLSGFLASSATTSASPVSSLDSSAAADGSDASAAAGRAATITSKDAAKTSMRNKPYKCSICGRRYLRQKMFDAHSRLHLKDLLTDKKIGQKRKKRQPRLATSRGQHKCTTCGRVFLSSTNLSIHQLQHSGLLPFKCPTCQRSFALERHLKIHLRSQSCTKNLSAFPTGGSSLSEQGNLNLHIETHSGKGKLQKCTFCDRAFASVARLNIHLRRHSNVRPYLCDICGRSVVDRGNFRRHLLMHTGARPHACLHCDRTFARKFSLKVHVMRAHLGCKPHTCSQCGRTFILRYSLQLHVMRMHGA